MTMSSKNYKAAIEEIKKSGYFDDKLYAEKVGLSPANTEALIHHYLEIGSLKGIDPSENFSTLGYLNCYKDVAKVGMNPLLHFVKSGKSEGRSPLGQEFNTNLTGSVRHLPRFGGGEYGRIDKQIFYDEVVSLPETRLPSLCVHLHLFHQNMADEFCNYLNNLPTKFDLLISISHPKETNLIEQFCRKVPNIGKCTVRQFENRGRDVAPWVVGFSDQIVHYDLFLHLHSKKSDYNVFYRGWRNFLLHNVIGSKNVASAIFKLFVEDSKIGVVYPPYFSALPNQPKWGANKKTAEALMRKIGCENLPEQCPDFPSGSFFWARVSSIQPLLNAGLQWSDFEDEAGQLDGTVGHAIERILCIIGRENGFKNICAGVDVSYNLINYWDQKRLKNNTSTDVLSFSSKFIPRRESLKGKKIAVYTCITGGFDAFIPNPTIDEGVDYYLFNDSMLESQHPYKSRSCRYYDPQPRRMARFVKMHPHFFFPEYDYVVWMDANVLAIGGVQKIIEKVMNGGWDLGLISHPIRESYIDEAEECLRIKADEEVLIKLQLSEYQKENIPNNTLIETNVIVFNMGRKSVKDFLNIWWTEICRYSLRDQVSVSYALLKSGVFYGNIIPKGKSVRDDPEFSILAHGVKAQLR